MNQTDTTTKVLLLLVALGLFYFGSIMAPAVEQLPVILKRWEETNAAINFVGRSLGNWKLFQGEQRR